MVVNAQIYSQSSHDKVFLHILGWLKSPNLLSLNQIDNQNQNHMYLPPSPTKNIMLVFLIAFLASQP